MDRRFLVLIVLILTIAAGCAKLQRTGEFAEQGFSGKKIKIAVMPFHSAPDVRDSGRIVADILANEMYALGNYEIVAPELLDKRISEQEDETLSPAKAGELSGAPYILAGSVTEYTYKAGVGETPVVGVTVRLLQASTAEVLWSATRTASGGGNWFQEDSLSQLTARVCQDIARSLNSFLQKYSFSDKNNPQRDHSVAGKNMGAQ